MSNEEARGDLSLSPWFWILKGLVILVGAGIAVYYVYISNDIQFTMEHPCIGGTLP